jgi:hypothetical protein
VNPHDRSARRFCAISVLQRHVEYAPMSTSIDPFVPAAPKRKYISVKEFCDKYRTSRSTVAKLLREKQIETIYIVRARRLSVASIEAYFRRMRALADALLSKMNS